MIKTIDIAKTTDKELAELIRQFARQNGDHYLLQEDGEPMAALISQEEFERYQKQRRLQAAEELRNFLKEQRAIMGHDHTEEEVERDVLQAIQEVRRADMK
jgi:PHD/YefM family antitoxin component YafN of YafNO toxin-antitoxin module